VLPRIGMVCSTLVAEDRPPRFVINQAYSRAIAAAGGVPLLMPALADDQPLRGLFDAIDGLLLPGGADLQPSTYGESPHPLLGAVDPPLDDAELRLARWALEEEKPVLGICRGQQCLNVAAGGGLIQDIASQVPSALVHRVEPRSAIAHSVRVVEPESRLGEILGPGELPVNSLHHQAVGAIAPGFEVVAVASDGVVEGIERPGHPFALAVQFHPEELVPGHAASERLLRRFVLAAAARAS